MTSLAIQFFIHLLRTTFTIYAAVVVTHFALQTFCAHRHHRRSLTPEETFGEPFKPSIDVVVTAYNEDPASLRACFESLLNQDYTGELRVHVIDDHSPNRPQLAELYAQYAALPGWRVLLPDRNRGKRHAQDLAFRDCHAEILVTIDSDTIVAPDGIRELVRPFADPSVGAVTGDVGVTNWRANTLTRLIGMRYWIAFNQERAAQSLYRTVLCCSGPLAAYRRAALEAACWREYINQTFRGIACTYGDDRHLTNLILASGYDTLFVPAAKAITNAPETLRTYLKQQLRWNKSFYRELLWTLPFLLRRPLYIIFELLVQTILPLLLTLAITTALLYAIFVDPHRLLRYTITITIMALARTSYAIYRTRRLSFLLFVVYGFLHAALLVPLRIRALTTLNDNGWGTRNNTHSTKARRLAVQPPQHP